MSRMLETCAYCSGQECQRHHSREFIFYWERQNKQENEQASMTETRRGIGKTDSFSRYTLQIDIHSNEKEIPGEGTVILIYSQGK